MSFIQGNINSKEDLIEAMDAMREMLTQGDLKAELELELAETKHKLAGIKGEVIGGDYYTYYDILCKLEINLESRIQKLEEADKGPQKVGYDELDDEDDEEAVPTQSVSEYEAKKFLESFLENTYGLHKLTESQEVEEEEPAESTSEVFLEEILDKINARVQSEVDDLRNNPWKSLKGWYHNLMCDIMKQLS